RPDGAVEPVVAVELAAVGVEDLHDAGAAVERDADDGRVHHAVVARTGAEVAAVHGLDGADARERVPAQAAAGLGPGGAQRGPGVGGEHAAGDPGALGGLAQPARVGQLGDRDGVGV